MRVREKDGVIEYLHHLGDSAERVMFRTGQRPGPDDTTAHFGVSYSYVDGAMTEFESIEYRLGSGELSELFRSQSVVREHPLLNLRLPLSLEAIGGPMDVMVRATLMDLGHTESGGPENNRHEPWAHFQIDEPDELLRAFGDFQGVGRQLKDKDNPSKGSYLEKRLDVPATLPADPRETKSLILPFVKMVGRRLVTFAGSWRLTIDYGADGADGRCGPMIKATVYKVIWFEGDQLTPQGMMA